MLQQMSTLILASLVEQTALHAMLLTLLNASAATMEVVLLGDLLQRYQCLRFSMLNC